MFHKNVCKLEFDDRLWIPFLGQSQSDVVVFAIFFQIYNILVTKWKHVIVTNYIITFNK